MLGTSAALLRRVTIACIGPITAATAAELGLNPRIIASTYTVDGLIAALRAFYGNSEIVATGEVRA
jgi:uroporphyrinogen III methyltransferase/synthase